MLAAHPRSVRGCLDSCGSAASWTTPALLVGVCRHLRHQLCAAHVRRVAAEVGCCNAARQHVCILHILQHVAHWRAIVVADGGSYSTIPALQLEVSGGSMFVVDLAKAATAKLSAQTRSVCHPRALTSVQTICAAAHHSAAGCVSTHGQRTPPLGMALCIAGWSDLHLCGQWLPRLYRSCCADPY
jgi:hypothetical protein